MNKVKSVRTEWPDYRRVDVHGRVFTLMRRKYRAGRPGRRYSGVTWLVTERDPATDTMLADLGEAKTVAAAEKRIEQLLIQQGAWG